MSELKRFDIVGKYADEETMYEFRPDGECYDADEADKVIRHNKYKRCLAMAEMCGVACDKWTMKKNRALILGEDSIEYYSEARRKVFLYMRWRKRWLKIAEQFKEDEK